MADLPDPSTLTDEELDKILAGGDEEQEETLVEPVAPKPEEEASEEEENSEETEEEKSTVTEEKPKEEERQPSRREQRRIHDILQKYGDPEKTSPRPENKTGIDYEKELEADTETIKRLQEDRKQAEDNGYNQGMEQAKSLTFITRLEIDAPRVEAKYPLLDKDSGEFKPEAANDINTMYLALTGYNSQNGSVQNADIRYADFIDTIFNLANDIATHKVEESTTNIKKQAAQTGLRPDGSAAKKLNLNKAPEDMTDEELDAYLAQAIPKR